MRLTRMGLLSCILLLLGAIYLPPPSGAEGPGGVFLRLKGQPGQIYRYTDDSIARKLMRWTQAGEEDFMESDMRVLVETEIKDVGRRGRMTLNQRLRQMVCQRVFNGHVIESFDSTSPGDVEAAKNNPQFAYLLAFLKASWKIEQDATGEVIDYDIITEGLETVPAGFELVLNNFVESIIEEDKVLFPAQAVKVGESWDGGIRVTVFPQLGRVERKIKCTLQKVNTIDGERTAVIKIELTAALSADTDSGTGAKFIKFKEDGTLLFAIERGRIKRMQTKQDVTTDYSGGQDPLISHIVTERTLKEVK